MWPEKYWRPKTEDPFSAMLPTIHNKFQVLVSECFKNLNKLLLGNPHEILLIVKVQWIKKREVRHRVKRVTRAALVLSAAKKIETTKN